LKRRLDEDNNNEDNSNDVVAENKEAISDELAQALKKVKRIVRMYTAEEKSSLIKVYKTIRGELERAQLNALDATLPRDVCIGILIVSVLQHRKTLFNKIINIIKYMFFFLLLLLLLLLCRKRAKSLYKPEWLQLSM